VRSRAAVVAAAKSLFLEKGYAGTTMEEIGAAAGLTKRTVYNNYGDKDALFTLVVSDVIAFAENFAQSLSAELAGRRTAVALRTELHDLARRLALGILRPEVIALRRLLIGEARAFPHLATQYFERAPGGVLVAIAAGFRQLTRAGLLRVADPRRAAEQFAYLAAGAALDRAMLMGTLPSKKHILACAHDGVETFLARYQTRTR
jgi:TetR/AcrR family transcriptional repressor of mexJK operon